MIFNFIFIAHPILSFLPTSCTQFAMSFLINNFVVCVIFPSRQQWLVENDLQISKSNQFSCWSIVWLIFFPFVIPCSNQTKDFDIQRHFFFIIVTNSWNAFLHNLWGFFLCVPNCEYIRVNLKSASVCCWIIKQKKITFVNVCHLQRWEEDDTENKTKLHTN